MFDKVSVLSESTIWPYHLRHVELRFGFPELAVVDDRLFALGVIYPVLQQLCRELFHPDRELSYLLCSIVFKVFYCFCFSGVDLVVQSVLRPFNLRADPLLCFSHGLQSRRSEFFESVEHLPHTLLLAGNHVGHTPFQPEGETLESVYCLNEARDG